VLLAAEVRGDQATSYRLLSADGRDQYPNLSEWMKRRTEVPAITSFKVKDPGRSGGRTQKVVVDVRHKPGLDPFIGLSAARERETWVARKKGTGWLVDPEPSVTYELPSDASASTAALSWAQAVQACDKTKAAAHQAVDELYGTPEAATGLCRSKGTASAGKVGRLQAGPSSADLIAQYSTDALAWAKVVPIKASSISFSLVLAPIGSMWKVVGVSD